MKTKFYAAAVWVVCCAFRATICRTPFSNRADALFTLIGSGRVTRLNNTLSLDSEECVSRSFFSSRLLAWPFTTIESGSTAT